MIRFILFAILVGTVCGQLCVFHEGLACDQPMAGAEFQLSKATTDLLEPCARVASQDQRNRVQLFSSGAKFLGFLAGSDYLCCQKAVDAHDRKFFYNCVKHNDQSAAGQLVEASMRSMMQQIDDNLPPVSPTHNALQPTVVVPTAKLTPLESLKAKVIAYDGTNQLAVVNSLKENGYDYCQIQYMTHGEPASQCGDDTPAILLKRYVVGTAYILINCGTKYLIRECVSVSTKILSSLGSSSSDVYKKMNLGIHHHALGSDMRIMNGGIFSTSSSLKDVEDNAGFISNPSGNVIMKLTGCTTKVVGAVEGSDFRNEQLLAPNSCLQFVSTELKPAYRLMTYRCNADCVGKKILLI